MGADISSIIRSKIADGTLPLPQDAPGKVWVGNGNGRNCKACDKTITPPPPHAPVKVWHGYGNGRNCEACDEPIRSEQRENELDVTDGTLRFDLTCFEVWQQGR